MVIKIFVDCFVGNAIFVFAGNGMYNFGWNTWLELEFFIKCELILIVNFVFYKLSWLCGLKEIRDITRSIKLMNQSLF